MNAREGQHLWSFLKNILAWILRWGEDKKKDNKISSFQAEVHVMECEMCFTGLHFLHITINIIK